MPWVPIEQAAGINFTFTGGSGISLNDSVVERSAAPATANWSFSSGGLQMASFRITALEYSAAARASIYAGPNTYQNEAVVTITEWLPSPIETGDVYGFGYWGVGFGAMESYRFLVEAWVDEPPAQNDPHNCDCDTGTEGNETRATLRTRLLSMLGYGAQGSNPPPGMAELLNNFLDMAQRKLYTRLTEYGWVRFFNWPLVEGVYLFDVPDNIDGCPRKLNPRKIQWVGIHKDGIYRPLAQGIDPSLYSHDIMAQWPTRYEIRQCIEIWPKPSSDGGHLVIKGGFGLDPFNTDSSVTTVKSDLVFLQALADAKAHYRKPDAGNIQQQVEVMLSDIVAGGHMTARYIPGRGRSTADPGWAYDWPVATPPFPVS